MSALFLLYGRQINQYLRFDLVLLLHNIGYTPLELPLNLPLPSSPFPLPPFPWQTKSRTDCKQYRN